MKPAKLCARWLDRLSKFDQELRREWAVCRRTGDKESIHRLRVVLRRLRVCLRIGSTVLGKDKVRSFKSWSQQTANLVARVRDYDVTLEWLAKQLPGCLDLRRLLQKRRERLWRSARGRFGRCRRAAFAVPSGPAAKTGRKLASRLAKNFEAARREILEFHGRLDPADTEHWHQLRRDLRRLRYLRELCLTHREQARDAMLRQMIVLQEFLGEAQNCVAAEKLLPRHRLPEEVALARQTLSRERSEWLAKAQAALEQLQRRRAFRQPL